jgi:parallel beta-helix repeat protein
MAHDLRSTVRRSVAGLLLLALLAGCASLGALVPEDEVRTSFVVVVHNMDDSGPGSLRAAIAGAFNGDVITFAPGLAGGTIALGSELTIGKSLKIVGPAGGITLSGENGSRVFGVNPGVLAVELEGLTITRGYSAAATLESNGGFGGAILNFGNLTLTDSTIRDSVAENAGGAIAAGSGSTLSIVNSTIAGNQAGGSGGGIYLFSASATISNSTVSGNGVGGSGGGVVVVGSSISPASLELVHATVANNGADTGGGIRAFSLDGAAVSIILSNSIVAGNLTQTAAKGPDIFMGFVPGLTATSSLVGTATGHGLIDGGDGNLVGIPAGFVLDGLGKPDLADNGGATATHALTPDSPALDAANATVCAGVPLDQRGTARPQGAGCDMGAFELAFGAPPPVVEVTAVALAASGTVDRTTGVANVAGTVTCTTPGTVTLIVSLAQEQKVRRVTTSVAGSTSVAVACDGVSPWAAAVAAGNGVFVNASAVATAEAQGSGVPAATRTVRLAWSR